MERRVFLIDGLWVLIVDLMGERNPERVERRVFFN